MSVAMGPTPRLEIYPERITENARAVIGQCRASGVEVACVTKVACAHPAVAAALGEAGPAMLADSRVENLRALRAAGLRAPLMLLRLPTRSRAAEVVEAAEVSLVSELSTIRALGAVSSAMGRPPHAGVLMVDLGDLREGLWPDRVVAAARAAAAVEGFELIGLGCNLACFGGVIPTVENMSRLVELHQACREATGLELPLLSGGNSSALPLLAQGGLPEPVNHLRVGEAILLGRNVIDRSPWQGTRQDTFVAAGEILELGRKPSVPVGARGQDAFGERPTFEDRGRRLRAILDLGRQDVAIDGLTPTEAGVEVLGGSSDHLIVDVDDVERELKPGDELSFFPDYGALLALSTSRYVSKQVMHRGGRGP